MNNKKILIGFTLFSAIVIFAIVYFSFNKPHKNFVKAPLDYTIQSTELFQKYQVDVSNANTSFLDKLMGTFHDGSEVATKEVMARIKDKAHYL